MQPFKRLLLLKSRIQIHDSPRCSSGSIIWSNLALDHFQCAPKILRNLSETDVTVSEGSTMHLKCAIHIETFGDDSIDREYLSYTQINWYWNNLPISNNSKGCDHNCNNPSSNNLANNIISSISHQNHHQQQHHFQHFQIDERIEEMNSFVKIDEFLTMFTF
ncbi:hypothetical protein QR98_0063060 [Sarcoptes scabiei]|uniref:Uncharacterized protein n=1 Tax=Sarcoptes scabiei TaxID=52283 RepID=A0A132ABH6_SARSC|nr:hypothetical protein QR98_0063060 [Sarcoptes scabiei]